MSDFHVHVLVSGLRQMLSTILVSNGRCLLLDPGFFPREIDELKSKVDSLGSLKALFITHSHWDRLPGYMYFPDTSVWISDVLVEDIKSTQGWSDQNLQHARQFDAKWYIQRPCSLLWPDTLYSISDDERRKVGEVNMHFLRLPGHSPDSTGLIVEDHQLLVTGDYLNPVEIPVVTDFDDYYRTLHRLVTILDSGIQQVIPGRGWKLSGDEARQIAKEDLAYLYQLIFFRDSGDWQAAENMVLPRFNEEPEIRKLHIENCHRVGAPVFHQPAQG